MKYLLPCYWHWQRVNGHNGFYFQVNSGTIMNKRAQTIVFLAICALCSSCSMFMAKWPPAVDPLQGWGSWREYDEESHAAIYGYNGTVLERAHSAKHSPLDKAIKDDYQNYLQKHEPGYFSDGAIFYEDRNGQHAVKIRVGRDGYYTVYIFMYDKRSIRTKIMKFANGGYAC